jgi:hypothetical protein
MMRNQFVTTLHDASLGTLNTNEVPLLLITNPSTATKGLAVNELLFSALGAQSILFKVILDPTLTAPGAALQTHSIAGAVKGPKPFFGSSSRPGAVEGKVLFASMVAGNTTERIPSLGIMLELGQSLLVTAKQSGLGASASISVFSQEGVIA